MRFKITAWVLLLAWCFFSHAASQPQLRWCLGSFPGFYGFNAVTKQPEGPSVDYMHELARRAGFQLVLGEETPASRCFSQLANGQSDLMVNLLKVGPGRPGIDYIQFGERWPDQLYYAHDNNLRLETPTQLSTLTLVTIRQYKVAPEIQEVLDSMKKGQLIQVDSILNALQMVAKHRVDAAPLPPVQVKSVLSNQPELAAQLKSSGFSAELVKPQAVYMGIAKHCKCPELIAAIKLQIDAMQQDGSSQRILGEKMLVAFPETSTRSKE